MQEELRRQQLVTEQVRKEAADFLQEMRALSERDDTGNSEKQLKEMESLREEVQAWKLRYARSRAQFKNLRASTYGTTSAFSQPHSNAIEDIYFSENGLVKDVSLSKFQIAMDEFIVSCRTVPARELLESLRDVVVSTQEVTKDVASYSQNQQYMDKDFNANISQARSLVSATANHLITATRTHSTSGGISPVFLLDAAAYDLSAAITDLVKIAKLRPSPVTRESVDVSNLTIQDDAKPATYNNESSRRSVPRNNVDEKSPSYGHANETRSVPQSNGNEARSASLSHENEATPVPHSNGEARFTPMIIKKQAKSTTRSIEPEQKVSEPVSLPESTPSVSKTEDAQTAHQHQSSNLSGLDFDLTPMNPNRNRYGSVLPNTENIKFDVSKPEDNTVIELQEYLENETVGVIDSIQELLTGIKGAADYKALRKNITLITDSVRTMLAATSSMMTQSKHWMLKEHGAYMVDTLENSCQRMMMLYGDSAIFDESLIPDKQFKQRLAGISFDLAKCTTELVKTVEEVNLKQEISQIDEKLDKVN